MNLENKSPTRMQTKSPIKKLNLSSLSPLTRMRTRSYTQKLKQSSSKEAFSDSMHKMSVMVDSAVTASHTFQKNISKKIKGDCKSDLLSPVKLEVETEFKNCRKKNARLFKCVMCNAMTRASSENKIFLEDKSNKSDLCSSCVVTNEMKSSDRQISPKKSEMVMCSVDTPIKCSVCNKHFNNENDMLSHKTNFKECNVCSEQFCTTEDLNCHKREHAIRYSCSHCSKTTPFLKNYLKHMDEHVKKDTAVTFVCAYCSESFDSSDLLRHHSQIHKAVHIPNIPCPWNHCSRKFTCQKRLDQHVKRHNGEKVYLCSRCGMLLTDCILYKKHRNTCRQRYIKLTCKMCGKECGGYSALKTHVRTHTGEKPFECNTCGKRFKINHHLKRHKLIHLRNSQKRHSQNCSTQTPLKMWRETPLVVSVEPAENTILTDQIQTKQNDGYSVINVKNEPVVYYISKNGTEDVLHIVKNQPFPVATSVAQEVVLNSLEVVLS